MKEITMQGRLMRLMMRALIITGLGLTLFHGEAAANTNTMSAVSNSTWSSPNNIYITNLDTWQEPSIIASTTTVATANATQDAWTYNGIKGTGHNYDSAFGAKGAGSTDIRNTYVHHDMFANKLAAKKSGWGALVLSFTDLVTTGAKGSATVRYPVCGYYYDAATGERFDIGANVTYTVTANVGWTLGNRGADANAYPQLQCAKVLYSGVTQFNCNHVDVHVEYFKVSTGAVFTPTQTTTTVGSLTPGCVKGEEGGEGVYAASFASMQYPTDGFTMQRSGYIFGSDADAYSSLYVDDVRDSSFYRRCATIVQTTGTVDLTLYPSTACRATSSIIDNAYDLPQWWSISSYTITKQTPPAPVKTTDRTTVSAGDTVTFSISQKVNTNGVDATGTYSSFTVTDVLDAHLNYVSGTAYCEDGTALPISAGTFSYDAATRTVSYAFSAAYLTGIGESETTAMQYAGETYRFAITATVGDFNGTITVDNSALVNIDGYAATTNTVTIKGYEPTLSIEKTAETTQSAPDGAIRYRVKITQTKALAVAKKITVNDVFANANATIDGNSLKVALNGDDITAGCSIDIDARGHGYAIATNKNLSVDDVLTVVYEAAADHDAQGTIDNVATAAAANASPISDNVALSVPIPDLSIAKTSDQDTYSPGDIGHFALTVREATTDALARQVVIGDTITTDNATVNASTIKASLNGANITARCFISPSNDGKTFSIQTKTDLAADAILIVTYDAVMADDALGNVINSAKASAENAPSVQAERTVSLAAPALVIGKSADADSLAPGDSTHYVLKVTERAQGTAAKEVVVNDTFTTHNAVIDAASVRVALNGQDITGSSSVTMGGDGDCFIIGTHADVTDEDIIAIDYDAKAATAASGAIDNIAVASAVNCGKVEAKHHATVPCTGTSSDSGSDKGSLYARTGNPFAGFWWVPALMTVAGIAVGLYGLHRKREERKLREHIRRSLQ